MPFDKLPFELVEKIVACVDAMMDAEEDMDGYEEAIEYNDTRKKKQARKCESAPESLLLVNRALYSLVRPLWWKVSFSLAVP